MSDCITLEAKLIIAFHLGLTQNKGDVRNAYFGSTAFLRTECRESAFFSAHHNVLGETGLVKEVLTATERKEIATHWIETNSTGLQYGAFLGYTEQLAGLANLSNSFLKIILNFALESEDSLEQI